MFKYIKIIPFIYLSVFAGCNRFDNLLGLPNGARPEHTIAPTHESPEPPAVKKTRTVMLAGQSNMVRIEWYALDAMKTRYSELNPGSTIVFVECAVGGTNSYQWRADGQLWNGCVNPALQAGLTIDDIWIIQGESDAFANYTEWATNWSNALNGFRRYWPQAQFIYAQIGITTSPEFERGWESVKNQQLNAHFDNSKMIKTDDLAVLADDVHLNPASAQAVGNRFVEAL